MDRLTEAIGHLQRGDWQAAHRIVQEDSSPLACWAHGIVHLMEGDLDNAGYWYRRAGRQLASPIVDRDALIAEELAALADASR